MKMDLRSVFVLGLLLVCCTPNLFASANVVFKVKHKFGAGERNLAALKAHDDRRHGRSLAAVDLPLGGNGSPTDTALVLSGWGCLSLSLCMYLYTCNYHVDFILNFYWAFNFGGVTIIIFVSTACNGV